MNGRRLKPLKSFSPTRDSSVAPLQNKMSDDSSPPGTYKTNISINGNEKPNQEMFNLLPTNKEEEVEAIELPKVHTSDSHIPEGMKPRDMSHDKNLEALANIPIHQSARTGDFESLNEYLKTIHSNQLRKKVNAKDENRVTPLHYAARYNHLDVARKLIECGANVDARDEEDLTPLHYTARYKREKSRKQEIQLDPSESELPMRHIESADDFSKSVCNFLIKSNAKINIEDRYGQTPLHYAAMRGNEIVAKELLALPGINLEAQDKQGMRPIHMAATHNQESICSMLLEAGCELRCQDNEKLTPLHCATTEGTVEIVKVLFEAAESRGSWVSVADMLADRDCDYNTPLHLAVENGNYEVVKLCLQKKANLNTPADNYMYPLHLASKAGDVKSVKLLVDYGARIDVRNIEMATPLHIAAQYNHKDIVEFFLRQPKPPIEYRDKDGFSPLLIAATYGHAETIHQLLRKGADYEAVEKNDKTAVYLACEEDKPEALSALLKYKAVRNMINTGDRFDYDPLHIAAMKGFLQVLKILIENSADVDSKNEEEQTPLHLAADNGRTNCVRELLIADHSAANDEDENSNTPLHLAALSGHSKVANLLLTNGADVSARNGSMWTPLDCAAAKGWVKTAKVLLEADSPVDPMDKTKTTPLHLGCRYGHSDVVKLLITWKANVTQCDSDGYNCLDLAIDNNKVDVATEIVNSEFWEDALRNETLDIATGSRTTPMRKLIKKMPDVAEAVFLRCMTDNKKNPEHKDYAVWFNYEFLDDTYANWAEPGTSEIGSGSGSVYGDDFKLSKKARAYTTDSGEMKKNHPLMIMVTSKREDLLAHPLVTALLKHKWNSFGRVFYYINFFIYSVFLTFLTGYIVETKPPFVYELELGAGNNTCDMVNLANTIDKDYDQPLFARIGKYVIMALAAWNLLRELLQVYQAKLQYLGWENLIEWVTYICALLLVIDFKTCQRDTGFREDWQWSLGATSIFLAWIELVLFLQKFPALGIYVVMFKDILNTFIQFFVVFVLFIVAFALGFYTLLQNQEPFASVWQSLMKTTVMMIGEFEYDSIFNDQFRDPSSASYDYRSIVFQEPITYVLFVVFMVIMSIIIMNLLVGLAVDDIKAVQEQAALKRMAMQVELALDVERLVPEFIRRRFVIQKQKIRPNERSLNPLKKLSAIEAGDLSSAAISKALSPELDEIEKLQESQDHLQKDVKKLKSNIKDIQAQNNKLESMILALLKKEGVGFEEEDFQDTENLQLI
ncbi:transient receptor potential cation channel subfamily A member 1 homolog isoform X4 [Mytilus edulis]|uniref:transient receptor potential cation channel subfamily A member 1 homolog isoform X4 n=1 Tax=Mytilus edulis TaxID=6550 RepID=UPI0039EFF23B